MFRGQIRVVLDEEGSLRNLINGYMVHDRSLHDLVMDQNEARLVSAAQVFDAAYTDGDGLFAYDPEMRPEDVTRLVYFAPAGNRPTLAWEVHPPGIHQAVNYRFFYDAVTGERLYAFNDLWFADQANVYMPSPGAEGDQETEQQTLRDRDDPDGYLTGPRILARNCTDEGETLQVGPFEVNICSEVQVAQADESGDFLYEPAEPDDPTDLFAEVHMYYHASELDAYLQELGYGDLNDLPLPCTVNFLVPGVLAGSARDLVPYDNAFFFPAGDVMGVYNRETDSLIFGQGTHVDFSYDGDVIYHEFGHAVFSSLTTEGQFSFDSQGMSSAPSALNEGFSDYWAGSFTEDPEIGEYVGPRIGIPGATARNIRNMDNSASCPATIWGESHQDSTHFSGALWEVRTAYIDELSGTREEFDEVILSIIPQIFPLITFDRAADIFISEFEDLEPDLVEIAEEAFAAHGFGDCERVVEIDNRFLSEDITMIYGTQAIGLSPWVPGFMQLLVRVEEGDLPADTITITFEAQAGDMMGQGVRVAFAVSQGHPISLDMRGTTIDGDWTAEVDAAQSGGEQVAQYTVEGGLTAGDYYFLPVGKMGGQSVLMGIQARIEQVNPLPEPAPEPTADTGSPDAGTGDVDTVDAAETGGGDAGGTGGGEDDDDGCGCSAAHHGPLSGALGAGIALVLGIYLRRRRLLLREAD